MCYSYVYSIRPNELFRIHAMREKYNDLYKKLLDIGDIIGIDGELFKTKVGEMTILVKDFKAESNVSGNFEL